MRTKLGGASRPPPSSSFTERRSLGSLGVEKDLYFSAAPTGNSNRTLSRGGVVPKRNVPTCDEWGEGQVGEHSKPYF